MYSRFDPEIQPRQSYMTAVSHLSLRTEMDQHALKVLTAKISHAKSKLAECNGEAPKENALENVFIGPKPAESKEQEEELPPASEAPWAAPASDGGDRDSAPVPGESGTPSKVTSALFDDDDDIEADLALSRRSSMEMASPSSGAASPLSADVSNPASCWSTTHLRELTDRLPLHRSSPADW